MNKETVSFLFILAYVPLLRLFALVFNFFGLITGVPYSHADKQAEWLVRHTLGQKWIDKGDKKLEMGTEELRQVFRVQIEAIRSRETEMEREGQ